MMQVGSLKIFFVVTAVAFASSCSLVLKEGCGCSAYYKVADGGEIQIQFREVMSETVGGHTDCGYKDVPIRVKSATIRGEKLREIELDKNTFVYAASRDFDPAKDPVTIEAKGTTFYSHPSSVKRFPESVFFDLKSSPPK